MHQTTIQLPKIKLVGITTRTNNKRLFESDPTTNAVAATVQKYMHTNVAAHISNRKRPGTTFCIYTHYESDYQGDFTYFIGEEVTSFEKVAEGLETLTIPAQTYVKFTNQPGPMPAVCIDMWQKVWQMTPADLGGARAYIADFEVYDERSHDHQNVVLDLYLGIQA
ncbi:MAG: hypothetical protein K0S07_519 [Chlamydiales bacterium]|jgi:predicted transcriptional regulator YdeE|nr:hypothetical protein [Chlamydiales bacterium]